MAGEIFISYRRADATWAKLLHAQLRAEGVDAWYDAHIAPGEDWRIATAKALEDSKIFVLLFSSNAAQSSDIAKELAAATLEKKLIIPVRLENIAPKGAFLYELASRNWVNAFENTEAKLAELAKGLAHLVKTGARDESVLPFDRSGAGQSPARKWRIAVFTACAALVVIAASAAAWLLWPALRWTVESSRPFISTLALEGEPAFSPDGKMLAYTSGPDIFSKKIYIRNVAGGNGIKVTNDDYDDSSPSWSPDGARLAYIARKVGEPCRIMVTSVPGGEPRQVGRCAYEETTALSWQPGTSLLYYTDQTPQSHNLKEVIRFDLDSGASLALKPKGARPLLDVQYLQCSPDGRALLLFGRENASTLALVLHDLASGNDKVLGKVLVSGAAAWSEDSRSIFAATASGIGSEITAYPVNGEAPYHVYAATINVSSLAAGRGGLLALETDPRRQNLARAGKAPLNQPDIIDPANGRTWAPTFAPDGTLAFLSNRSGTNAVWIIKPEGAPTLLYDGGLTPLFRLEFSPDGKYLAMPIATPDGVTIDILTANGSNFTTFHSSALGDKAPTWTTDSKEVVALDKTIFTYMRINIADSTQRRPAGPGGLWGGVAFHGDGTFGEIFGKPGYFRIDTTPPRPISVKYPMRWEPPPSFSGNDLLVPDFTAPGGPRILAQPLAGGADRVQAYAPGAMTQEGVQSKIAVNSRTGEIIYVAAVQSDSNIDLLTLARH